MRCPPREAWGPLACVGLAAAMAVPAIAGFHGWAALGRSIGQVVTVAAWAGGLALAAWLARRMRAPRLAGGRMVTVRGHAHDGHPASRHEAGHYVGAIKVGGRVRSARVFRNGGGLVRAVVPDAEAAITFLYAGQVAHGSADGAGADNAAIRETLREFPARQRGRVLRRCQGRARSIVAANGGQITRIERKLDEKGRA